MKHYLVCLSISQVSVKAFSKWSDKYGLTSEHSPEAVGRPYICFGIDLFFSGQKCWIWRCRFGCIQMYPFVFWLNVFVVLWVATGEINLKLQNAPLRTLNCYTLEVKHCDRNVFTAYHYRASLLPTWRIPFDIMAGCRGVVISCIRSYIGDNITYAWYDHSSTSCLAAQKVKIPFSEASVLTLSASCWCYSQISISHSKNWLPKLIYCIQIP